MAALAGAPSQRAAASDCTECALSGACCSRSLAQSGLAGFETGVRALASRLAATLWLPRSGGRNLRGSGTVSGHLLQGCRLGAVGKNSGLWTGLAGLLPRHPPPQTTMGSTLGKGGLGASPCGGVASGFGRPARTAASGLSGQHGQIGLAVGVLSPANDRSARSQGSASQAGGCFSHHRFGRDRWLQRTARDC